MAVKTLNDLLNEVDSSLVSNNSTVKTASAGAGAGNNTQVSEGANMGLFEMYQRQYGEAAMPKTASAQVSQQAPVMQKTAQEVKLEKLGAAANVMFNAALDDYLFKFAAEDIATREADASVVGVGDPQLPVNRPGDAAAPINTTPVYHDEQFHAPTAAQEQLIAEIEDVVNAQTHGGSLATTQEHPTAQLG